MVHPLKTRLETYLGTYLEVTVANAAADEYELKLILKKKRFQCCLKLPKIKKELSSLQHRIPLNCSLTSLINVGLVNCTARRCFLNENSYTIL